MQRILKLAIALVVMATGVYAEDVPPLKGRVNDLAEVISPASESQLENLLAKLEAETTAQVVILTMTGIGDDSLEDFSLRVASSWELGQTKEDNGLLIFYLANADRTRLEVGYGLEGAIPDGKAGEILRDHFRRYAPKEGTKDFDRAFLAAVEGVDALIRAEAATPSTKPVEKAEPAHVLLVLIFLAVVIVVLWLIVRRMRREDEFSSYNSSYSSSSPSYRSVSSGRTTSRSSRVTSTSRGGDSKDSPSSISIGAASGSSGSDNSSSGTGGFSGGGGSFGGGGASD